MKKTMLLLLGMLWLQPVFGYLPAWPSSSGYYCFTSIEPIQETGVITESADFWTGPPNDAGSMIFLKLAAGTEVKILERENTYYKVMHRDLIGYVDKKVIRIVGAADAPAVLEKEELKSKSVQEAQPEKPAPESSWRRVTQATSLRAAPDSQAKVYLRLQEGYRVEVLENSGRWWWKVRYKERTGWAKAALLERE